MNVLIDGTVSMKGFYQLQSDPGTNFNARNLIAALDDVASSVDPHPNYFVFGRSRQPVPLAREKLSNVAAPGFYCSKHCKDVTDLDQQLAFAANQRRGSLTAILTDLFVTDDLRSGTGNTKMEIQLRRAIRAGHTFGIWAAKASFKGAAYDIPGPINTYSGATSRPIFILLIGDEKKVRDFIHNINDRLSQFSDALTSEIFAVPEIDQRAVVSVQTDLSVMESYSLVSSQLPSHQYHAKGSADIFADILSGGRAASNDSSNVGVRALLWRWLPRNVCAQGWSPVRADNPAFVVPSLSRGAVRLRISRRYAPATIGEGATYFMVLEVSAKFPQNRSAFHDFSKWSADDGTLQADVANKVPYLRARDLEALLDRVFVISRETMPPKRIAEIPLVVRWDK